MSESTLPGPPVVTEHTKPSSWQLTLSRVGSLLAARSMVPVWLTAIVLMAAIFRFIGLDWDQGTHRHPDERFLTDVVANIGWPSSFSEYINDQVSPLNPRNVMQGDPPSPKFPFWVYGDFALTIVKRAALTLNDIYPHPNGFSWDGYGEAYKVGRAVSGIFDIGTLLVLFLLARRLYRDHRIALLAAFLFGATALSIQHSHFWVVDNFATFFVTVTLYWLVRIFQSEGPGHALTYALAGLFFGAALAIKVSVFTLAAVFGAVALYRLGRQWQETGEPPQMMLEQIILRMGLAVLMCLIAFRILQPYAFEGPGLLDVGLSERWLSNMEEVQGQVTGEADPPWGFQWANRAPIIFPLKNMVQWGMGLPLGIAAWVGWGVALWQIARHRRWVHLIPVTWTIVLFLHQGTQWVKSLRYFLPIYPMLVLLAAWLVVWLWDRAREEQVRGRMAGLFTWTPIKAGIVGGIVTVGTLLYAMAFTSIYTRPHTHIQASTWAFENIPSGSVVASEHYDEGFPVFLPEINPNGVSFFGLTDPATGSRGMQMAWYFEDNPQKLEEALNWLDEAEYIVTVSNRLYGSTARLPLRYPMTINYYQALFSGELGWERVADFTSGPQLFGIELDDQFSAEEAFSVYDHPRVQIFQKTPSYDREDARALLSEGVDWNNISRLTAKQWTESGGEVQSLQFTSQERAVYERSGSWSQLFNRASLQNQAPLLVWALLLELLGLLAIPFLAIAGRALPERGFALAKALGLLLVSWLVWMLASLRLVTFSTGGIALAILLVALGGVVLAWRALGRDEPRARLTRWWRRHGRLFLLSEAIFWGFFLLVLAVRWANPDLWYDPLGGEKPMDFAYLNATIKSAYFPPMDPWFAGGYINYYYFGFVLVALLTKFTGIVPEVAYNLAIPTLFAMLATGVWGVALGLLVPFAPRQGAVDSVTPATSLEPETHDAPVVPLRLEDEEVAEPASDTERLDAVEPVNRSPVLPARDEGPTIPRGALSFAFLAALFVAVIGNLAELQVLMDSLHQLSSLTFRSGIPGLELLVKSVDGLVRGVIINGQTLPGRMEWPYWNATRVITAAPGEVGPINEMPWFTFLYADLHAHLMALPYTVLAIGLALSIMRASLRERGWLAEGLRLGLLALVIGALWPLNTWDFPTYALVAFAGLGLREWRRDGSITTRGLIAVLWRWALVLVLGRLLFQPFHAAYGAAYTSIERWTGSRTSLGDYLLVHGFFLFSIFFALVSDFVYGRGHNGAARIIRFNLDHLARRGRANALSRALVRPMPGTLVSLYALALLGALALLALVAGWGVAALILLLLAFALLLFFRARPEPQWQMALFFIILGLGLTLAVEVVVLKGDIGRMNTVFKFYLQVWVLWGIAAAIAAARVAAHLPAWLPEWRGLWRFGFTLLFGITLLYPIFSTHAKVNDRFDRSVGATLDGSAFMEKAVYHGAGQPISLNWDGEAIRWMQENVPGSPTIAEMNTYPTLYGWGNRYAVWTGNPAIVGWDWHQRQQRAAAQPEEIGRRIADVTQNIYGTPDASLAHETLQRYGADYLIVGALERALVPAEGIEKFEAARGTLWDLVYENQEVRIYRVLE